MKSPASNSQCHREKSYMKKTLLILLLVTVFVQGWLYISYPLSSSGDDQEGEHFLVGDLLSGNLLIGNLRYNTGYPFVIAPVAAITRNFGRLNERLILLVQVLISSAIPFLAYDIIRTRRNQQEAIIVALVLALEPFGLQWAHLWLPDWLVAFCLVLGLWLLHRALMAPKRFLPWVFGAGIVFGVACLARYEFAAATAMIGVTLLAIRSRPWRQRLAMFVTLGGVSAGILLLYLVVIQYPSTKTWKFSCMTGVDEVLSVFRAGIPITASNGPATTQLLNLLTLKPPHEVTFVGDEGYRGWRNAGSWATPEDQTAYLNQPFGIPDPTLKTDFPANPIYYLGVCPTDDLLLQVHAETVRAYPVQVVLSSALTVGQMLIHVPKRDDYLQLPPYKFLKLMDANSTGLLATLGFHKADDGYFFRGHLVWVPGIWLFSNITDAGTMLFWLMPLALIWVIFSRDWFYRSIAVTFLVSLVFVSLFNTNSPRIYGSVYPLAEIVIGGFLAAVFAGGWTRIRKLRAGNSTRAQ